MASKLARKRTVTYSLAAAFLAVVVVGSGVTVAAYKWDWGGDDEPPCPSPREATGAKQPEKVDPDDAGPKLKVVDEGLKPYGNSVSEGVSYGVVLENTTDLVLYDAVVSVSFIDSDGEDPTEVFTKDIRDGEERASLKEVPVPMILPGDEYGFGSTLQVASDHIFLTDDEIIEMDEVNYDDLTVEVSVVSGEWWEPNNDVRSFEEANVANVARVDDAEALRDTYFDGSQMVDHRFSYELDYDGCVKHPKYTSSAVLYSSEGEIVGGKTSIWPQSLEYFGERDLGGVAGPENVVEAKVFAPLKPVEPNLEQL